MARVAQEPEDVQRKDIEKLEEALCILADYEHLLKVVLARYGPGERVHSDMCSALREIVD